MVKITFYGGAKTVSGVNYLLEVMDPSAGSGSTRILVDCGLFQGSHFCERLNFERFPYQPKEIEAVFITHAHIDHIGRLPKLCRDGFQGKIFSTTATKDFAAELLLDSEHLLREEAEREKKPPIYEISDIDKLMTLWEGVEYYQKLKFKELEIEFKNAGHILGSSIVIIKTEGKKIVFSGDLGNIPNPLTEPMDIINEADYCLIESAYGDRLHEEPERRKDLLEDAIEDTIRNGGVLLIPAFAMERTQELLYELNELIENNRIPRAPVFIDSPLAIKLTKIYQKYQKYFSPEAKQLISQGDRLFQFPGLKMTLTTEESKAINDIPAPKVIIAGSGMSHGGRILHHERRYLSDPKSAILFIGWQSKGSLGREILDGAKEVKIFGETIPVNCRVKDISSYSAHADQAALLKWLKPMRQTLKKVFVVQGEEEASLALAQKIKDEIAVEAAVPSLGDKFVL